jgi:NDP-hexose-3-ketoreductase
MPPVRLGVVGCSAIAVRRVLPAIGRSRGVILVAVASRDRDKAARVAGQAGCEPVTGYEALLERTDLDAIYLPLPVALHAPWTHRALEAGKHVLIEKPMSTSAAATAGLVQLARERGLVVMENFMFLHHAQHHAVRRMLDEGRIGALRHLSATFTIPRPATDDIRHQAALGGGSLLDVGVYPLRVAQLLLGDDVEVVGVRLVHDRQYGVDVGGAVLLAAGDATAHLTFGMDHAYRSAYELCGTSGRIGLERAFSPPAGEQQHATVSGGDRPPHRVAVGATDQYAEAVDAFARAVRRPDDNPWAERAQVLARLTDQVRRQEQRPIPEVAG